MNNTTLPPTPDTLEAIQARITEREQAHKSDIEKLLATKQAIAENIQPVHEALQEQRLFCERIDRAKGQRENAVQRDLELRRELVALVGLSGDGNFNQYINVRLAHLKNAPLHLSIIDEWLADAAVKLDAMNAKLVALCKERNALHLLPDSLKHLATEQ